MSATIRLACPADWPAITSCHRIQNQRDGTTYPLPPLFAREGGFAPGIALALVAVRDGAVIQCCWFERTTVEMMFAGIDPEGSAGMAKDADFIGYLLRQQGVTGIDCKVPIQAAKPLGRRLQRAGFQFLNEKFAHYFKDLTEVSL